MDNYERLIGRIAESAGLEKEEIERKVEAKKAKLSGLISREGAAQIVAAELGISFESERLKIAELVQGMRRANVVGKITKIFPVREFSKNGREGKVASLLVGDDTSNIRVALWDMNHISLIERGELKEGDVIEIMNGSVRNEEMHLSGFSDIKKSKEKLEEVKTQREITQGILKNASVGSNMKVRAVIVQTFEPRYFESKQKEGERGVVWNVVLDDGTETVRAVMFGETIKQFGFDEDEIFSVEKFNEKRTEVIGEEMIFSGTFRMNSYFNILEMSVNGVEKVDADSLVQELETKV